MSLRGKVNTIKCRVSIVHTELGKVFTELACFDLPPSENSRVNVCTLCLATVSHLSSHPIYCCFSSATSGIQPPTFHAFWSPNIRQFPPKFSKHFPEMRYKHMYWEFLLIIWLDFSQGTAGKEIYLFRDKI